jgi:hypothetical protein
MMAFLKERLLLLVLSLLAVCFFTHESGAFTYFSYPYGEKIGALDARSLSMGGTGVAFQDNAFALGVNPACLSEVKHFGASSSVQLVKVDEDRAFPYHDSFDGFVGFNTYAMNSHLYGGYAFGVAKNFDQGPIPTVGVVGYPVYDWKYDYFEEVRDDNDLFIGNNVMEHRGGIYAISVGLAEKATSWLSLGAALNFLNGDGQFESRAFGDTIVALDRQEVDCDGMNVNLGAMAQVSPRIRLGLTYRSEAKLDGTAKLFSKSFSSPDSSRKLELTYPYSIVMGVEYRPRNDLTARLNFDVEFTKWSHFKDAANDALDFNDVWQFSGGLEHRFFLGHPFRFGFRYQPSYQDKEVTTTAVSFGTGFSLEKFHIDFGGEVGTRSWRETDLFPESYYGGVERTGKDRVKESLLRAMVSIDYQF